MRHLREWNSLGKINITYEELIGYLSEDVFNTLPEWADYPALNSNKDILTNLFHLKYDCKELGYATTRKFLARLELKFNEVAPRYNLAMDKYLNDKTNIETVGRVKERTHSESVTTNLSIANNQTNDNVSNFFDTPKTNLPNPLSKPTNATTGNSSTNQNRTDEGSSNTNRNEKETDSQGTYIVELNKIIDSMRVLNTDFIDEFADLFLNIKIFD